MKKLCIILFLFGCVELQAQLVQVSGFIYTRGDSSVTLPYVAVINKRTKTGMQSNPDGFYTILMSPGDTVEVHLLGFKRVKFALPSSHSGTSYHKDFYLKDEYIVHKGGGISELSWETFSDMIVAMKPIEEKKYIIVDKQQLDKSPVNATPHLTLNGPISWLYGKLSRRAKELDKLEDLKNGTDPNFVSVQKISDEYVMKATGLPQQQVKPFLEYCNLDNIFYAQATDYDIRAKFQEYLPGFKEHYDEKDSPPVNNSVPVDSVKTTPQ